MTIEPVIVVGVDGSDDGARALAWAVDEALLRGASIRAVHAYTMTGYGRYDVVPVPDLEEQADRLLAAGVAAATRNRDRVPTITAEAAEGTPAYVLSDAATGADLLVVGSHGHGRFASTVLGSVSSGCVRRSPVPVVVVPSLRRSRQHAADTAADTATDTAAETAADTAPESATGRKVAAR